MGPYFKHGQPTVIFEMVVSKVCDATCAEYRDLAALWTDELKGSIESLKKLELDELCKILRNSKKKSPEVAHDGNCTLQHTDKISTLPTPLNQNSSSLRFPLLFEEIYTEGTVHGWAQAKGKLEVMRNILVHYTFSKVHRISSVEFWEHRLRGCKDDSSRYVLKELDRAMKSENIGDSKQTVNEKTQLLPLPGE